ncbi:hypothetical protein Nepgr_021502 [Nepenthes gracilis]|uniref:Pentatricopeptide repeat-containing protein n=1 Tax=Nepenthes gracilis TaxID=150966 RepID=A0AAD3SZ69_NEPGR|nr:hypothetical protein Nepgr_021502 [Nepenthes gracilis]
MNPQHRAFFNEVVKHTRELNIQKGKTLHAKIIKAGLSSSVYMANCMVNLYAKCGHLPDAELSFDQIDGKDVVSWSCLINAYSQKGGVESSSAVMGLFSRMRAQNTLPNAHTFVGIFNAMSNSCDVLGGRKAHSLAIKTDICWDVFVGSSLINMYCKLGPIDDARQAFDRMPERNSVSWATMVSGYAMHRMAVEAVGVFKLMMQCQQERENEFVLSSVLSALALPEFVDIGRQVHCIAIKDSLVWIASVGNALVTMYSKCGSVRDALQTFEMSSDKNSITWSAMITGLAQSSNSKEALTLFSRMHYCGIHPSEYTFVGVVNACSDIAAIVEGKQLHCYLVKMGFENQIYIITALVDMYAKCGSIDDSRKGFDYLQEPDVVLWTSMIAGFAQNGDNESALSLYGRMEAKGIPPNELTVASILKACSSLAALDQGKQVHARVIKYGFILEVTIGSALSTMYTKCGSVEDGNLVFRRMIARDIVSWNAMISGISQNGCSNEALELFEEMIMEGIKPDAVTFVNILSACSRMGLVERGWKYFNMMSDVFAIAPALEHYACMVDVLSRAGRLIEAKEFIETAKVDHGMCLWRILLSACRNYRDYDLGAYAGEKLMELGSQESSAYVMLSKIYTALGKVDDVQRVMRLMKLRGVGKEPGCSWIELKNLFHVFAVGDQMHPQITEIQAKLQILTKQMIDEGYRPAYD